jgi:hypothetical protein
MSTFSAIYNSKWSSKISVSFNANNLLKWSYLLRLILKCKCSLLLLCKLGCRASIKEIRHQIRLGSRYSNTSFLLIFTTVRILLIRISKFKIRLSLLNNLSNRYIFNLINRSSNRFLNLSLRPLILSWVILTSIYSNWVLIPSVLRIRQLFYHQKRRSKN